MMVFSVLIVESMTGVDMLENGDGVHVGFCAAHKNMSRISPTPLSQCHQMDLRAAEMTSYLKLLSAFRRHSYVNNTTYRGISLYSGGQCVN